MTYGRFLKAIITKFNYSYHLVIIMYNEKDIPTLRYLDGVIIEQSGGYWVKFEVRQVAKTAEIPHGIRYSLTLHDTHGKRVMGFDNAHAVKGKIKASIEVERHTITAIDTQKMKVCIMNLLMPTNY